MKLLQKLLAATSIFAATAAIAGPPVTVTFKNNNTTTDATYRIVTTNESSTYANASPKPATTVSKLGSNSYSHYINIPDTFKTKSMASCLNSYKAFKS